MDIENCLNCGRSINDYECRRCTKENSRWNGKKVKNEELRLNALGHVDLERNRQDAKWGEQNHPPQLWVGILGEEFGEYCQSVNETVFNNGPDAKLKGGYDRMMEELTHVAAVAVGAMEALMRARQRGDI